jgi:hypothetical protein
MEIENPKAEALRKKIREEIEWCMDVDLLDLIYKMLVIVS